MRFTCKVCGGPSDANGVRSCGHDGSGIIAHCSANCYGEGGAASSGPGAALARVIRRIIATIKRAKA
jgi:hypothetical protein